jgi:hypothetical protein
MIATNPQSKMTQLIENKRRRSALIATLSHFSNRHSVPIREWPQVIEKKGKGCPPEGRPLHRHESRPDSLSLRLRREIGGEGDGYGADVAVGGVADDYAQLGGGWEDGYFAGEGEALLHQLGVGFGVDLHRE